VALKGLGALGVVKPTANSVQVILGPHAELVADELKAMLAEGPPRTSA
jgi:N-acetylglucosamine PTS system EIICBA or EIICB component